MSDDPRFEKDLERYLEKLNKALSPIKLSERARIVVEVKKLIVEKSQAEPQKTIPAILSSFGEPQTVAHKYLIDQGLSPRAEKTHPIAKWVTIGFLGAFALLMITILILVFQFSPLISIDEKNDRVTFLGGIVDVKAKEGSIQIGKNILEQIDSQDLEGSLNISTKEKSLSVNFGNGQFEIKNNSGSTLKWDCSYRGDISKDYVKNDGGKINLDFKDVDGITCSLDVPKTLLTSLVGGNGLIEVKRARAPVSVILGNGSVRIDPDLERLYRYDLKVVNGATDEFESSEDPKAIPIRVQVTNGKVEKQGDN